MRRRTRAYLVTGAAISREQEFRSRRRRYALTMAMRVVLLVAAALTVRYSVWLAVIIGVTSAILPWIAVLMANDGPPKTSKYYRKVIPEGERERAIAAPSGDNGNRVILDRAVIIDETGATVRPDDERGKHEQQ